MSRFFYKIKVAIICASFILVSVVHAQQIAAPSAPKGTSGKFYGAYIDIDQAKEVAAAAIAAAKKHDVSDTLVLAIVNGGGELVYLQRSPSAKIASVDVALAKARSAAYYGGATSKFYKSLKEQKFKNSLALPRSASMGGGGLPIVVNGYIIGAIGVTGGYDEAIAEAGRRALSSPDSEPAKKAATADAEKHQTTSEAVLYGVSVSLNQVPRMLAAAEAEAKKLNIESFPMVVVDTNGDLVYLQMETGGRRSHLEIAVAKARTAARYGVTSKSLEAKLLAGDLTQSMALPDAASMGWGGVPIIARGRIIGGVSVAGVRNANDHEIALAAAKVLADDDPMVAH